MDIVSAFAARRVCYLAGRPFWIRPISLEGLAEIVAWLDDMLPGRAGRTMPPKLSDDAGRAKLSEPAGAALVAWIAVRDAGVGYEEAAALWLSAGDEERSRLLDVLFARRRTMAPKVEGQGRDVGEMWCGPGLAQLIGEIGPDAVRALSLDQLEFLRSGGEADKHADPDVVAAASVHEMWLEARKRWDAEQAAGAGDAAPAPEPEPDGPPAAAGKYPGVDVAATHAAWLEGVRQAAAAKQETTP